MFPPQCIFKCRCSWTPSSPLYGWKQGPHKESGLVTWQVDIGPGPCTLVFGLFFRPTTLSLWFWQWNAIGRSFFYFTWFIRTSSHNPLPVFKNHLCTLCHPILFDCGMFCLGALKRFPSLAVTISHVLLKPAWHKLHWWGFFIMLFLSFQTLMPLGIEDDGSHLEKPMKIPKELWIMVDYLYRNAVQQVGGGKAVRHDGGRAALRKSISLRNIWRKRLLPQGTCGTLFFPQGVKEG